MQRTSHKLTPQLWRQALLIRQKYFITEDTELSRQKLAELLNIPEAFAREILFALKNLDVIKNSNLNLKVTKPTTRELVFSDVHIPYQDEVAIYRMFEYIDKINFIPDIIVILGDLVDFYKISNFVKDPTKLSLKNEIDQARQFLSNLRDKYPQSKIIYYEGNHEHRLAKYIMQNAGEIYELVDNLLEMRLGLNELNVEYITDPFKIGKLWHLHGHEKIGRGNPEYITNVMWKYVHDNFIVGHYHRVQEKMFKSIDGKMYWGGVIGHLASQLDYAKLNNWNQGFGLIEYDENGNFMPQLKIIADELIY